jgi:hypothetical protein
VAAPAEPSAPEEPVEHLTAIFESDPLAAAGTGAARPGARSLEASDPLAAAVSGGGDAHRNGGGGGGWLVEGLERAAAPPHVPAEAPPPSPAAPSEPSPAPSKKQSPALAAARQCRAQTAVAAASPARQPPSSPPPARTPPPQPASPPASPALGDPALAAAAADGVDVDALLALARAGDSPAVTARLRAHGYKQMGPRLKVEAALFTHASSSGGRAAASTAAATLAAPPTAPASTATAASEAAASPRAADESPVAADMLRAAASAGADVPALLALAMRGERAALTALLRAGGFKTGHRVRIERALMQAAAAAPTAPSAVAAVHAYSYQVDMFGTKRGRCLRDARCTRYEARPVQGNHCSMPGGAEVRLRPRRSHASAACPLARVRSPRIANRSSTACAAATVARRTSRSATGRRASQCW